jgi:hypothetical protein
MTTKVEESIQVDVPVSTAYNQWTQFEDFPHFMGGVKEVRQLDDRRLHWVAEIAGVRREWEAAIVEQVPDQKVAWAATGGATNAGAVRFAPAGPGATTVFLTLEYEPEGAVEQVGDKLGIVGRQVKSDLKRFKELIEDAGYESGAWRGSVRGVGVGTPGVEDAAGSRGDSGKAGVSATTVVAGAAAAVAGVAAAGAAAAASKSGSETEQTQPTAPPQETARPEGVIQSQEVTIVDQPPPDTIRDDVLVDESAPEGYTASTSTEGVERGVRDDGDNPMVGGGSR